MEKKNFLSPALTAGAACDKVDFCSPDCAALYCFTYATVRNAQLCSTVLLWEGTYMRYYRSFWRLALMLVLK